MGANTAGIYGAQIFRQDDKPLYRRAFSINIGVLAFGVALIVVRYVDDRLRRKRRMSVAGSVDEQEQIVAELEKAPVAPTSDVQPQTVLIEGTARRLSGVDPGGQKVL